MLTQYTGRSDQNLSTAKKSTPIPSAGEAQNIQEKILSFGAWPIFNNYFTVYIWHEIVHFHINLDDTSHAVNQLLTDNELRVFLNDDKFFPLRGHQNSKDGMKKSLRNWEQYKKSPTNLNVLVKSLS